MKRRLVSMLLAMVIIATSADISAMAVSTQDGQVQNETTNVESEVKENENEDEAAQTPTATVEDNEENKPLATPEAQI